MNIEPSGAVFSVYIEGITAVHRFSIVPSFDWRRLDAYSVIRLGGTVHVG